MFPLYAKLSLASSTGNQTSTPIIKANISSKLGVSTHILYIKVVNITVRYSISKKKW